MLLHKRGGGKLTLLITQRAAGRTHYSVTPLLDRQSNIQEEGGGGGRENKLSCKSSPILFKTTTVDTLQVGTKSQNLRDQFKYLNTLRKFER